MNCASLVRFLTVLIMNLANLISVLSLDIYDYGTALEKFRQWRYPEHITSPLVSCPSEGFFPHPRDCRWFYRCHDIDDKGSFRRFYFECDPNKIYISSKNKCDYVHVVASEDDICGSQIGKNGTSGLFDVNPEAPEIGTNEIGVDRKKGVPPHEPPEKDSHGTSRCIIMIGDCHNRQICSPGSFDHLESIRVCRKAFYKCTLPSISDDAMLCPFGSIYNPSDRYCVYEILLCKETAEDFIHPPSYLPNIETIFPPSLTPPTTTSSPLVTTSSKPTLPTWQPGPPYPPVPNRPYWTSSTTSTTTPTTTTTTTVTTTTTTPSTTTEMETVLVEININRNENVPCSSSNRRPYKEWMKKYFCTSYARCLLFAQRMIYLNTIILCEEFVECRQTPTGGWVVAQMKCPAPWMYSFEKSACQYPPRENELCENLEKTARLEGGA